MSAGSTARRKVALLMGVANHRSIAWACVEAFLRNNYDCILTHQDRYQTQVEALVQDYATQNFNDDDHDPARGRILGALRCNDVRTDLPVLFQEQIPECWHGSASNHSESSSGSPKLDALVHSIAHGDLSRPLTKATWAAYREAQHSSAYSFLEMAQCARDNQLLWTTTSESSSPDGNASSLTALSFLGAVRALEAYRLMGPAKAALEALVRGMAVELGQESGIRVNAVSAGPINTLSARSAGLSFSQLPPSPLGRPVTAREVAEAVFWISHHESSSAVTGQTIYVDGGFSSIVPTFNKS